MDIEKDEILWNQIADDTNKAIDELLYGHYPTLNQKEKLVYEQVLSTVLECDYNTYDAIISYTLSDPKNLFANEQEVENTINDLVEKGTLKSRIYFGESKCNSSGIFSHLLNPRNVLELSNMDVAKEASEIMDFL